MFDKFNFYDFLGYLLPGAAVSLMVYWVGRYAFGVPFPQLQPDLGSSFLFLGLSYVAGHLVQGFGSMYEQSLNKTPSGTRLRLSEKLLQAPAADGLSADVIAQVKAAASWVFGVKEEKDIFEQAYALVVQKGLDQHTSVFLALNGLARGMLAATGAGVVLAELVAWKQLLAMDLVASSGLPAGGLWRISSLDLGLALVAMLALIPVGLLFNREFNRFRGYFARSVYYNFLAWYGSERLAKG